LYKEEKTPLFRNAVGPYMALNPEGPMRAFRTNPHPVDMKDLYHGQQTVIAGKRSEKADWDEEFTDAPVPAPTMRSNLLKISKSVSEKLFSIEFGKISF
jgi:hypothetical protein